MKSIPKAVAQKSATRRKPVPKAKIAAKPKVDPENPWIKYAGIHENDPEFLEVMEIIRKEREKERAKARRQCN
jgi:hypothetical protein